MRRSVTASRAASSTGATGPPARSERIRSVAGWRSCSKISSSRSTEELGQDPVDHHGRCAHRGLVTDAVHQLERLADGHLLRRAHGHEPGLERIGEDLEHPVGLAADHPDLHQVVDGLRRRQLADDVAAGRRVDDDEVVVALAHLVAELADGEDLAHAGSGGGHEVEGLGQRADPPDDGDAQMELQVLAQRGLGVHRHRPDPGRHLSRREVGRRRLEERGHVALGVDLADQDPPAVLGGQLRQAGRDRRLAHAALPRDEDEAQVEQPGRRPSPPSRAGRRRSRQGAPKPTRRSEVGAPTST